MRRIGLLLAIGTLLIAIVATQWPFDYFITRFAVARRWERIDWSWFHFGGRGGIGFDRDFALNLAMLLPLGVGFGLWRHAHRVRVVIEGLAIGAGASIALELAQLLTRNRHTSLPDVWHNALGCVVGTVLGLWIAKR